MKVHPSLLAFALFAVACQTTNYRGPGNSGPLPAGTVSGSNAWEETADGAPPRNMTCGSRIFQTISVTERAVPPATCATQWNYIPLFDQAMGLAEGLRDGSGCRDECPAYLWITRLETVCQMGGTMAGVLVGVNIACLGEGDARPKGIAVDRSALTRPDLTLTSPGAAPAAIGRIEGVVPATFVGCNPVEAVTYDYREPAQCGAANYDFRAHVEYAEKRAKAVCEAQACAPGCKDLDPPRVLRSTWSCNAAGNEAKVVVEVQCCKP